MLFVLLFAMLPDPEPGPVRVLAPQFPRHDGPATAVAYSPDGKRIATCGADGTVCIWDADTDKLVQTWHAHPNGISQMVYGSDGKTILTGDSIGRVSLWDIETGEELTRCLGHREHIVGLAWLPEQSLILSVSFDGMVRAWDGRSGRSLRRIVKFESFHSLAIHPGGETLAIGSNKGVAIHRTDTFALVRNLNGTLRQWNLASGRLLREPGGHLRPVQEMRFSPDGRELISLAFDDRVITWDATTGRVRHQWWLPRTGRLPAPGTDRVLTTTETVE